MRKTNQHKSEGVIKRPIKQMLIVGCVLFVLVLCLVLGSISYSGYRQILFDQCKDSTTDLLKYTASNIDNDDLKECIDTGVKSEKFNELQRFLDMMKESVRIDYIYIIVPLNDNETDNIQSVIAGFSKEEYENGEEMIIELNSLSGETFSSQSAEQYLDAYQSGQMSFFESNGEWGKKYTGVLPLRDSKGEVFAALCIDVNMSKMLTKLYTQAVLFILVTVILSLVFIILFVYWSDQRIIQPIRDLEESVAEFAAISHLHKSPDELVLTVPPIHTANEVESLSNAVVKMSDDIREYAQTLSAAEEASKQQSIALGEALTAAQAANKAKTAFLSNMSHEIRTPMNTIIGLDNIALNEEGISDSTRDYLEKIGSSAEHLLGLINDILDMSRIESGRVILRSEDFSFAKAIAQVNTIIGGQCHEKGLNYECEILGDVDEYYVGDDMKLRQIMINILGNAVKFTPEGGFVSFVVQRVARFDKNATLRFTIQDTGVGMSKEYLPKIFESFSQEDATVTTKYGSTGLGMAITKNLIELMHGDIRVESEKGKGTTFTVTLTLGESDKNTSDAGEIDIRTKDLSVLVIDDDPVACEHAKIALGQAEVACETVLSGKEALDTVRMRSARSEKFDLILVDWSMPEMDGLETTRQLRKIVSRDTVIMIQTSYGWDEIVNEGVQAGVDCFISKPLFAATVLREYKNVIGNRLGQPVAVKADLAGRRILVAEDVAINAEILQMVLESREMSAEIAENGERAVEMFEESVEGHYSAILMDMRMPVMGGLEATGAIRAMERGDAKTIPIIALTANAFDEDVRQSMQAGLNAHLTKPVDPAALFETLENLIEP